MRLNDVDTGKIKDLVDDIHSNRPRYEYHMEALPQLEAELQMLKDRVELATRRAEGHAEACARLEKRLPLVKAARERFVIAVSGAAIPGARGKVQELDREIERCEGALADAAKERDRQRTIADAHKRLIDSWPQMEDLKRLRAMQAELNRVDGRLSQLGL